MPFRAKAAHTPDIVSANRLAVSLPSVAFVRSVVSKVNGTSIACGAFIFPPCTGVSQLNESTKTGAVADAARRCARTNDRIGKLQSVVIAIKRSAGGALG